MYSPPSPDWRWAQCDPPGQDTKCWDNDLQNGLWNFDENWNPFGVPTSTDNVYHLIGGTITMDSGTDADPTLVNSFTFNPGAAMTLQAGTGLFVAGDVTSLAQTPQDRYAVTLSARSLFEVDGSLNFTDATVLAGTPNDLTEVIVGGDIRGVGADNRVVWSIDDDTHVMFEGSIDQMNLDMSGGVLGVFDPESAVAFEGLWINNVDATLFGASSVGTQFIGSGDWVVGPDAAVYASEIQGIPNGDPGVSHWAIRGLVETSYVWGGGDGGITGAQDWVIDGGELRMNDWGSPGVPGADFEGDNLTIRDGSSAWLFRGSGFLLSGTLTVDGLSGVIVNLNQVADGNIECHDLVISDESNVFVDPLGDVIVTGDVTLDKSGLGITGGGTVVMSTESTMTLVNGAVYDEDLTNGTFEPSRLEYGDVSAQPWDVNLLRVREVLLGDVGSLISKTSASTDPTLTLNAWAGLDIRSKIHEQASDWDATGVLLEGHGGGTQYEVISPDFEVTVFFDDSNCVKPWGALEQGFPVGGGAANVTLADVSVNRGAALQSSVAQEAMYIDGDVLVHPNSWIDLNGFNLYYTGSLTCTGETNEECTTVSFPDEVVFPKQAVRTLYGDWNGDCVIEPFEWLPVRAIIEGTAAYDPFYDFHCDGTISDTGSGNEFDQFFANFNDPDLLQQVCTGPQQLIGGGAPEMEQNGPLESDGAIEDVAQSIEETLSAQELSEFIDTLLDIAENHAGTAAGDNAALLAAALVDLS